MAAAARYDLPVAGGALACYRLGREDGSPVALAVHGITSNSQSWRAVARALGDRAALLAPDLRGRGRSNHLPPPYGFDAHVRDLLAVLDEFELQRAVLVGHSLGAYIAALLALKHPDRVRSVILVDGGLPIPGTENVALPAFLDAFLGPALARLRLTFPDRGAYRRWWRAHPAMSDSDVRDEDLDAYADHDLVGTAPDLHSSVVEDAVRADGAGFVPSAIAAPRITVPAHMLCAPRGLLNEPSPMQPIELAQAWADARPRTRAVDLVADVNHYTITLGTRGAPVVADAIAAALQAA